MKRGDRLLAAVLTFLTLCMTQSFAACVTGNSGDAAFYGSTTTCAGTENKLPDDHTGPAEFPDGGTVSHRDKTYELEQGGTIDVGDGETVTITKGKAFKTDAGTEVKEATRAEVKPDVEKVEKAAEVRRGKTVLQQPETVEIKPNGDFVAKFAEVVTVGGITARGASDVSFLKGVVSIGAADRIEVLDGLLGEVQQFSGSNVEFQVAQARNVVIGCVSIRGLENSNVAISENEVAVHPIKDAVDFTISDCKFRQITFQGHGTNAQIVIPRSATGSYEVSEGELTCHGPTANDRLETSALSTVTYGQACFSCLSLGPGSTYWYSDENLIKDFGLSVPADASAYSLCLRKRADTAVAETADGIVDFVDNEIILNGRITYRRLPVIANQLVSLVMDVVYDGRDDNNQATFELDDSFDTVISLIVKNDEPTVRIPVLVSSGYYSVYERLAGDGSINRFGRFNDRFHAAAIQSYSSDFGASTRTVSFYNDQLMQVGPIVDGSHTRVEAICDQCSPYQGAMSRLGEFRNRAEAARCGV